MTTVSDPTKRCLLIPPLGQRWLGWGLSPTLAAYWRQCADRSASLLGIGLTWQEIESITEIETYPFDQTAVFIVGVRTESAKEAIPLLRSIHTNFPNLLVAVWARELKANWIPTFMEAGISYLVRSIPAVQGTIAAMVIRAQVIPIETNPLLQGLVDLLETGCINSQSQEAIGNSKK